MYPVSFGWVRFHLGSLLQGQMWYLIPMMDCISPIIGHRGFRCEDNLYRVPTAQGKQGKLCKVISDRENTGNLKILEKHGENTGNLKMSE